MRKSFSGSSTLAFRDQLPKDLSFNDCLLIYDKRLLSAWGPWIKRFPCSYGVKSGEGLKDLRAFPTHVEKILKLTAGVSPARLQIVAFGGGSVGDFAGFFASVFKRGVGLVHVPSTWLAAIDSAHGGKTALNAGKVKNQIGTFYPAQKVYLVREVLSELGEKRFLEAWPEAVKVSLLHGSAEKILRTKTRQSLWRALPALIKAKMQIVARDPLEKKGIRHLLNLGHTLGHVLEAELGLPHGVAVGHGLSFALRWSETREGLRDAAGLIQQYGLPNVLEQRQVLVKLREPRQALLQDKKMAANAKVRFIFLKKPGTPVIREVTVEQILAEIQRQS